MAVWEQAVTAAVSFAAGVGSLWLASRKDRAEYEQLKRLRRLRNTPADERLDRAGKAAEMLINLTKNSIPPERLSELMSLVVDQKKQEQPDTKTVDAEDVLELAHSPSHIFALLYGCAQKTLYWGCLDRVRAAETGEEPLTPLELERANHLVARLESEIGEPNRNPSSTERETTSGILAALLWVTGAEVDVLGDGGPGFSFRDFEEDEDEAESSDPAANASARDGEPR